MEPIKVFVSSTYRDSELRETALKTISSLSGFVPEAVEISPATMRAPEGTVLDRIQTSDLFLLIIGTRYGTLVPGREESFTEYEYQAAKKAGKPILAFVLSGGPQSSFEDRMLIQNFVDRLRGEHSVRLFKTTSELRDQIATSLATYRVVGPLTPDFEISFDPDLTEHQIAGAFEALAAYYRACGGVGLSVEFERQRAKVREPLHA